MSKAEKFLPKRTRLLSFKPELLLTNQQIEDFKLFFPRHTTKELADIFEIGVHYVHKLQMYLNLTKAVKFHRRPTIKDHFSKFAIPANLDIYYDYRRHSRYFVRDKNTPNQRGEPLQHFLWKQVAQIPEGYEIRFKNGDLSDFYF